MAETEIIRKVTAVLSAKDESAAGIKSYEDHLKKMADDVPAYVTGKTGDDQKTLDRMKSFYQKQAEVAEKAFYSSRNLPLASRIPGVGDIEAAASAGKAVEPPARELGRRFGKSFGDGAGEEGETSFFDQLNAKFGRGSSAAKFAKTLKGGGALFAIGIVANEIEAASQKLRDVSERGGGFKDYAEAIPILGQFMKAGENIAEAYTGAAAAVDKLKKATADLRKTQEDSLKGIADRYTKASAVEVDSYKSLQNARREDQIDQAPDDQKNKLRIAFEVQDRLLKGQEDLEKQRRGATSDWEVNRINEQQREFEKNLQEELNTRIATDDRQRKRQADQQAAREAERAKQESDREQQRTREAQQRDFNRALESAVSDQFRQSQKGAEEWARQSAFRGASAQDSSFGLGQSLIAREGLSRDSVTQDAQRNAARFAQETLELLKQELPRAVNLMIGLASGGDVSTGVPSI